LADAYSNLGIVYQDLGNMKKAEEYLNKSFQIYDKVLPPNSLEIADFLINQSIVCIHKKEYEKAIEM
jgi:tetratricopeptide (TPR) repeat protein